MIMCGMSVERESVMCVVKPRSMMCGEQRQRGTQRAEKTQERGEDRSVGRSNRTGTESPKGARSQLSSIRTFWSSLRASTTMA